MRRLLLCTFVALQLTAADSDLPANLPKVLWHEPPAMTSNDWICGPGGCDGAPLAPFQFVKEDVGGTNPKVQVHDARGRLWSIKLGAEAIPECFGSRYLMALGYGAEHTYMVKSGKIVGVGKLRVAGHFLGKDGSFIKVRFEGRDEKDLEFLDGKVWGWVDNPFLGSHELAGLKIVMMLLSNWDAKDSREGDDSNNAIFRASAGGRSELLYAVSDWGASLGRWGGPLRRDQSDCDGYGRDTPRFVKGVEGDQVHFGFEGKHGDDLKRGISVEDARWLLKYADRITPQQLEIGLEASGATERQAACWAASIERRVGELRAATR